MVAVNRLYKRKPRKFPRLFLKVQSWLGALAFLFFVLMVQVPAPLV